MSLKMFDKLDYFPKKIIQQYYFMLACIVSC